MSGDDGRSDPNRIGVVRDQISDLGLILLSTALDRGSVESAPPPGGVADGVAIELETLIALGLLERRGESAVITDAGRAFLTAFEAAGGTRPR